MILAFEDDNLTMYEKQVVMLRNVFMEIPDNVTEAVAKASWYLNGGKESESEEGEFNVRLYSFEKDANFIFAAFRQTHGIDLETAELHWWKFLALFMDLGQDTTFCQLIALRKRVKSGKATKEEIRAAESMGDMFIIDDRTPEEKAIEAEFERKVAEGIAKRKREKELKNGSEN